jgi:carboxyl-terminal processing protease
VDEFKSAVNELLSNGADGLIFDLRNNLGGILSVVVDMIAYLAEDGLPVVSYTYKNAQKTLLDTGRDGHSVDVPMVVVVNEYTASAAEIFAAALRDYELMGEQINVTTVGKTTFGKGVMQRVYTFADGSAITFTVAYYDPPLGENYHGVGVVPDISVNDSVSLTGGDAQMGAAIDAMRRMLFAA